MQNLIEAALAEARDGLAALLADRHALAQIEKAAGVLIGTLRGNGTVFSCGNGGSLSDAMHFAEELTGRYRRNRPGLAAVAIADPTHLTCVANDFGYAFVFSRYVESHGRAGDTLVALSTSGRSANVIKAVEAASGRGMKSIVLTGRPDGPLVELADVAIITPAGAFADRVQELHIKVLHILIELIEREFFPENYRN